MLNLIECWHNTVSELSADTQQSKRAYPKSTHPLAIDFDKNTIQSSFEFTQHPNIVFVRNSNTLEPADYYRHLLPIDLTLEENKVRKTVAKEQKAKNPHFYDGNHLVISNLFYEDNTNTLYLEAHRVSYSFIIALNNKRFPTNSILYNHNFFKAGVLAPLVTSNGVTALLQRSELGLFSVPGGFLEPQGRYKRLNFKENTNLVIQTAIQEIREELAGIKDENTLRFQYSEPQITALSIRKSTMGTIEFIAPSFADCHSSYLAYVISNNQAKDAYEHTSKHHLITLNSNNRNNLLISLLTGETSIPGAPLYLPVTFTLARLLNPDIELSLEYYPRSSGILSPKATPSNEPYLEEGIE